MLRSISATELSINTIYDDVIEILNCYAVLKHICLKLN